MNKFNVICELIAMVLSITLCGIGFSDGNSLAGWGWMCAALGNLDALIFAKRNTLG